MNVKIIRFLNGEEVIGNITEKNGKYTIKKGAVIVPVGEQQLGMVPWLPHAEDNTITVDESKIVFVFVPLKDLANQYNTNFGSGLVVPNSKVSDLKLTGV